MHICMCFIVLLYAKFYVLIYYHVNYCKAARALVHCQRYALKQMFNYCYIYMRVCMCVSTYNNSHIPMLFRLYSGEYVLTITKVIIDIV